jgi:hypothetical protein
VLSSTTVILVHFALVDCWAMSVELKQEDLCHSSTSGGIDFFYANERDQQRNRAREV